MGDTSEARRHHWLTCRNRRAGIEYQVLQFPKSCSFRGVFVHEAFLLVLLCSMTAFGAQASDAAKAAPKGDAARGQAIVSTVCIACHGPDGNSPLPVNPKLRTACRLSAQADEELQGHRRQAAERTNPVMNGMIAAYDEGQMRDLAAYFSAQTQKGETAKNRETVERARSCIVVAIRPRDCLPAPGVMARPVPAFQPNIRASAASFRNTWKHS